MRSLRFVIGMQVLALLLAYAGLASAAGECRRTPPAPSTKQPELDGPGSFGPLHNTVTLGCLKYVGSIEQGGVENVMIRDENGALYHLKVGDLMGENNGVISRIDENTIYVTQHIMRRGKLEEVVVRFPKK